MKIDFLKIQNFRNIEWIEFNPAQNINVLLGENAQGKTNLLEAIYTLSTSTSFRGTSDQSLVRSKCEEFYLAAGYTREERSFSTQLVYGAKKKNFKINGKRANHNHSDRLRVVLFTPDDLYLVKGSPSRRRAFLDFVLRQLSKEYLYYSENYTKLLKKRNFLLKKEQTDSKSFQVLEELFTESAARVILARMNFVQNLDEIAAPIFAAINQGKEDLKIRYALSFPIDSGKINLDNIRLALGKQIMQKKEEEKRRQSTVAGPHLDDLHFYLGQSPARIYASQGQQRTIAVTVKLAEIFSFYRIMNFYPIFLMDEVLAELDEARKKALVEILARGPFQTFLTTIMLGPLENSGALVNIMREGRLMRKE